MRHHRGPPIQHGAGIGSIFSGIFKSLMPVAKSAAKTVGKIAKSEGVRSAGRYLKKEAGRAAIDTALEALQGQKIGTAAKNRLKSATKNILMEAQRRNQPSGVYRGRKTVKRRQVVYNPKRRKVGQRPLFDDDYDDY